MKYQEQESKSPAADGAVSMQKYSIFQYLAILLPDIMYFNKHGQCTSNATLSLVFYEIQMTESIFTPYFPLKSMDNSLTKRCHSLSPPGK